jgi:hypothetical protein
MNDDDRKNVVMYFKDLKPWPKSLRIDWGFNYKANARTCFLWTYLYF